MRPLFRLQEIRTIAGEPLSGFSASQAFLCRFKALEHLSRRDAPESRWELLHTYSFLNRQTLFWKALSNFCGNLTIGHTV